MIKVSYYTINEVNFSMTMSYLPGATCQHMRLRQCELGTVIWQNERIAVAFV